MVEWLMVYYQWFNGLGKRMDRLMHNHGNLTPSARAPPRVKPEAEENADLDKGKRMERLINEYLKNPESARPVPRVKPGKDHENTDANLVDRSLI